MKEQYIAELKQNYSDLFVVVSPPRCSSTALSRIFWEHPMIRYYSHEPFEGLYYLDQSLEEVVDRLKKPLDLLPLKRDPDSSAGNGIVIKEMPYQVGPHFKFLANLATAPLVFLIRDPRVNISSRMRKKIEVGDSPLFPLIETGWLLLKSQIDWCQAANKAFFVVDSSDFRNHPAQVLRDLFSRLHLSYSEELLAWRSHTSLDIDNLEGKHTHLYRRVLQSSGLAPDGNPIPPLDSFPEDGGFFHHVRECLNIYREIRLLPQLVTPFEAAVPPL